MSAGCPITVGLGKVIGLVALVVIIAALRPAGAAGDDAGRLCLDAARIASEESGVPYQVLVALSMTETGRDGGNGLMPWPWAVNRGGQGLWFAGRAPAAADAGVAIARGETSIDLGCFQINWGWHGTNFASVDAMLDPVANARYAAALIAHHYARSGSWRDAAVAYHSTNPEPAARYLARFGPIYDALTDAGEPDPGAPHAAPAARTVAAARNAFPLLRPGPPAGLGSLVPVMATARPLFPEE